MPVIRQKFIFRSDLKKNPDWLYLFGDNLRRAGYGGQAKEMRGEPNAVGVATKKAPDLEPDSFFSDKEFDKNCDVIDADLAPAIAHLQAGGVLVVPEDGLGTGLSDLPRRAPMTHLALVQALKQLEKDYGVFKEAA